MLPQLTHVLASSLTTICPGNTSNTSTVCQTGIPKVSATSGELKTVLELAFGIIAAIAVLVIVIAGFRMVISQGNPEAVKKAREAVIGAVVGLIIAISAETIVVFILGKI